MNDPIKPFAAGLVLKAGDTVLVIRRSDGSGWGLPGGSIEPGETPADAAVRECFEETGIYVEAPIFLENRNGFALFRSDVEQTEPQLNREHDAAMWTTADAMPTPAFMDTADIVNHILTVSTREYDANGWFEVRDNPISRVGVFEYSGKALGIEGRENEMFGVFRSPDELAAPECVASFRLLPWINDHTMIGPIQQQVDPKAVAAEDKGVHGVIGETTYYRDGVLYGNIKVFSNVLASLIASGKCELSAGYKCEFVETPGEWEGKPYQFVQTNIRGNHLALVEAGRMGPGVAVQDSAFNFIFDSKELHTMKHKFKTTAIKAMLGTALTATASKAMDAEEENGELTVEQLKTILQKYLPQLQELMAAMQAPAPDASVVDDDAAGSAAVVTDTDGEDDKTKPAAAVATDEDDATKKAATDEDDKTKPAAVAATDAAELARLRKEVAGIRSAQDSAEVNFMQRMAERNVLAKRLTAHIGVFDHAEMTLSQVREYGAKKLGLSSSASPDTINAYLSGLEKASGVGGGAVFMGSAQDSAESAKGNVVLNAYDQ